MWTKDFYNPGRNGLDIKNNPGYIQYADHRRKLLAYENVLDLIPFTQALGLLIFSSAIFSAGL